MKLKDAQALFRSANVNNDYEPELIVFLNDSTIVHGKIKDSKLRLIAKRIQNTVRSFIISKSLRNVIFEFAGNDEFWLDLTEEVNYRLDSNLKIHNGSCNMKFPTLHLEGETGTLSGQLSDLMHNSKEGFDFKLFHGAQIGMELINTILEETGIQVSGGVGTNKFISKLAGAVNKPKSFTIIPPQSISQMSKRIEITTIPGFKGKLGNKIANLLEVETMYELSSFSEDSLVEKGFGIAEIRKIICLSHGVCNQSVNFRTMSTGLNFSRTFGNFCIYNFFKEVFMEKGHLWYFEFWLFR